MTRCYVLYFHYNSPFQLNFYQVPQKNFAGPLPVFKALQKTQPDRKGNSRQRAESLEEGFLLDNGRDVAELGLVLP